MGCCPRFLWNCFFNSINVKDNAKKKDLKKRVKIKKDFKRLKKILINLISYIFIALMFFDKVIPNKLILVCSIVK